jgi:hypothetical protein
MAPTENDIVKDEEVVHIQPSGDDDEVILPEATGAEEAENEGEEAEDDTDTSKPDELVTKKTAPAADDESEDDEAAPVEGETPREKALRQQIEDLRAERRKERTDEIIKAAPVPTITRTNELSDEDKAIVGKYKPGEVAALREVLPVLAKEMGYVRGDQLAGTTYADKSQEVLDGFLDKHPEYLPQNDKDGTLWNAFKAEYGLYKQPTNPRDFSKIFDRIHRDVFGIKPAGALSKVNAQQEKVRVASHAGASSTSRSAAKPAAKANASQYRTDALKGFTDDQIAEMFGE